jgi:Contractile injection system tube protein
VSTFPNSPRLLKGAIVGIDLFNPLASIIVFQYNPDSLTRTIQPQMMGNEEGARTEVLRLTGAPIESIKLDAELDATDQLEQNDPTATTLGVYPQLSALEMLVYPKSEKVIIDTALMFAGTIEIVPPMAPFTVLIWGIKRVVPVRITDFSITEEAYDVNLNPIRAKVSLGFRVLSYNDFSVTHPGYYLFLAHQVVKEAMALINTANEAIAVQTGVAIPSLG